MVLGEPIPLLPAIDEKRTLIRCKKKLREYPRWREIAQDSAQQRITQSFTFEPRNSQSPNRAVERLVIRKLEAENELEEIEQAVSRLFRPDYRLILWRKFLAYPTSPNYLIAQELGVESTAFQKLLNQALLAFSHSYRHGSLVVEE